MLATPLVALQLTRYARLIAQITLFSISIAIFFKARHLVACGIFFGTRPVRFRSLCLPGVFCVTGDLKSGDP